MQIPKILFGDYSSVYIAVKSLLKTVKGNKQEISEVLLNIEKNDYKRNTLIVMADNLVTRGFKKSYFPNVVSTIILGETTSEELKKSYLSCVDKTAWLLLTILANNQVTQFYYDQLLCKRICDGLYKFWDEIVSAGEVYFNFLEENKGSHFWKNNLCFMKCLLKLGFSNEVVQHYDNSSFPEWYNNYFVKVIDCDTKAREKRV